MSPNIQSIDRRDGVTIVALTGKIDMARSPDLHRGLVSLLADRPAHLLLNLSGVSYLDSSGVGTLVEIARRVKAYSGLLTLAGPNDRVRGIFEITRLNRFFRIVDTQEEALGT